MMQPGMPGMAPPGLPPPGMIPPTITSMTPAGAMAAAPVMPSAPVDVGEPNLTLYVNNINDKINTDLLKKNLREVFGAFGDIQDLICMKSLRRRGQAWIVFKDLASSGAALKALQGFPLYNRPIKIAYSKSKSDVVSKADGTFEPRAKIKNKADRKNNETAIGTQPGMPAAPAQPDNTVPSRTLFIENLPPDVADQNLRMLFQQFVGFQDVRSIPGRNVAFADFTNEAQAGQVMNALQGFAFTPQNSLKLTYAR